MYRNKKTGFTLVELLAVIVILAIILVIAVPKVMSIIEDSKKSTLETTAKMIASAAEKAKIQNTLLGNNKTITCEDVVKLNNVDYDYCGIEFKNDNALVTILGSGKFEGLYVCEGDKTNAAATDISCSVEYGNGAAYISKLQAFKASDNGLIIDDTADKNIRYAGSNPNNYVYFNCKDVDSNDISYGEENYDYANSCEVWRIIGVFEVDNGSGKIEKRIKLVSEELPIRMSFDSSASYVNYGYGINQWGASTYEDGSVYEGADLMRMLNGYYVGEKDTCTYCNNTSQPTCKNDCSTSITPVSVTSLNMVEDTLWKGGAQKFDSMSVETMYIAERGTRTGKICEASSTYEGMPLCTDTVKRTTEWVGKIGLIYASDYGYASTDIGCAGGIVYDSTCENNNWLYPKSWYWVFSSASLTTCSTQMWHISTTYNVVTTHTYNAVGVRPSLYLSSNVQIIGGNGDTVPYKLDI